MLVEASPEIFAMFKEDIRAYTVEALEKRGVEVMTGEVVAVDRARAGHAQVGNRASGPHARLGSRAAGERADPLARPRARARQPCRRRRRAADRLPPGGLRRRRHRGDHRREDRAGAAAARLGRAAVGRARGRDDRGAGRRQGDEAVQVPRQGHDGDDRPRCGRGADARRQDDEGQERPSWPGEPCISR